MQRSVLIARLQVKKYGFCFLLAFDKSFNISMPQSSPL